MFDHKPTDGAYFNAMIANRNIGNANADVANENARQARAWKAHAEKLQAELDQTKALLENAQMSQSGLQATTIAYRDALKASSPNHVLFSNSGQSFKDGRIKNKARIIYENAFDTKGVELRISTPKSRRED